MGSSASKTVPIIEKAIENNPMKHCLRIDRIIASGCDYLPPNRQEDTIRVGVIAQSDPQNPLSGQAIRIGDGDAYRLKSFQEGEDTLQYTFENNITLTLMKRRNSVVYNLKTPELDISREINPAITRFFKPISMNSTEIDKIEKIFKGDQLEVPSKNTQLVVVHEAKME